MTISIVIVMLVMSTITTIFPFGFGMEASATNVSKTGVQSTNLKRTSENLIDASFSSRNSWSPITWTNANGPGDTIRRSWGSNMGGYDYFNGSLTQSVQFSGNGSATLRSTVVNHAVGIGQSFTTVPGHRYRISYNASYVGGGNRFDLVVNNGSTIYHHLANPAPIWGHTSTAFGWGTANGARTGEFTATSNSASVTLEVNASTIRVSGLSIVDLDVMEDTTINTLSTDSNRAEGRAEPNASLTIKAGATTIATGQVGADGHYNVAIPKQKAGVVVTATATLDGQTRSASTTVTQGSIAQTTIGSLSTDSEVVEGRAEPNASITIKDQSNRQLANGQVGSNGTYRLTIPKQVAGTVVTATATKNGKNSSASTTVIQGDIAQTTIHSVTTDSVFVEGNAEPSADIVIKDQYDNQLVSGKVASNGTYRLPISKQTVGTVIIATATKGNKTSTASTTVVKGNLVQTTIETLTTNSTIAQGSAEPNANIVIQVGSVEIASGRVGSDGRYALPIPKQAVGTIVYATATANGKTSSANTTVRQGEIIQTTIGPLTTDSVIVEGMAEPNANIIIENQVGTQLASGRVGSDGSYHFGISKQVEGTIVTATATANGKTSSASTTVVKGDIAQTTIDPLTTTSLTVTGTAEPNANIVIKDQNDNILASGRVGSEGLYHFAIQQQILGTVVTATASANGKTSSATTIVTNGDITQTTIASITTSSTKATGTAEPNAAIVIKNQNNNELASGRVGSDGNYSLIIPRQAAGTIVTATATANGKTSSASTIVVNDAIAQTTINNLTTNSTQAVGTAEPNAIITIYAGSTILATGRVGSDGNYSVTIPKQAVGTTITATAEAKNQSSSASTQVTQGTQGAILIKEPYYVGYDSNIQAEATGDVTKVYLELDGVRQATVMVSGSFNYYARDIITSTTQTAYLVGLDASNNELSRVLVPLRDGQLKIGTITPSKYIVGSDSYVTGTYTGAVTQVALSVNGTILKRVAVLNGEEFRYYAKNNIVSVTDDVYVIGYNAANDEIAQSKVPLQEMQIAQTTIRPLTTDSVVVTGTAEPNANIVVKNQNNVELVSGQVGSDGNYHLTIPKQPVGTVVTATATANGKTSSASTTVMQGNIADTTIGALTTDSTAAEGTAEPNATIVLKDQNDTEITSGRVGSDGRYYLLIPKQAAGTIVTATATAYGKTSSASTTVTQAEIAQTTIQALTTDSVKVEGTAEPNATIVFKDQNNNQIASGLVEANGTYSIAIPKQSFGTVVTATATKNDKVSSASTTVTQGNIAQTTIQALTTDSVKVEGTAEPNATIVFRDQNHNQIASGLVEANGTYSITIPRQTAGTVVTATATKNGETSSASTTVIQNSQGTITVTEAFYVGYDSRVQAEVTGDITKVYLEVDGVRGQTVPVSGSFGYYARNVITSTEQTVYLVGLDSKGAELDRVKVTLKDGQLKIGTVSPDDFVVGIDGYVRGSYTGSVTKVGLSVNGTELYSIPVNPDGTFQYYARPNILDATDQVYVIGYNVEKSEITREKVTLYGADSLVGSITPTPNYFVTTSDRYIQGTYSGNVKYVSLVVDGREYGKVPVNNATEWSYYSKGKITPGNSVSIRAYNVAGVKVDEKPITVYEFSPDEQNTITANNFLLNEDRYVTGSYTGGIKYVGVKVNGVVLDKVPVSGGSFNYYVGSRIKSREDEVVVIGYNGGGVQVAEAIVQIDENIIESTITANNYSMTDSSIVGTYSGDVKYIYATINGGAPLSKIPVDGTGTYTYYIKRYVTSAADEIVMTALNARNEVVATTPVVINQP